MEIDLISDIHLEFKPWIIDSIGRILVIAGDLGNPHTSSLYRDFLIDASQKYSHVILVAGNHEYYSSSIDKTELKLHNIVREISNVYYLQRDTIIIDDIQFLGCTLWSNPTSLEWLTRDGEYIKDFSLEEMKVSHIIDRDWLMTELDKPKEEGVTKRVVVTHYLPSFKCIDSLFINPIMIKSNEFYASDCDDLVSKVDMWLAGHTHKKMTKKINCVNIYINPRGYPWESPIKYKPTKLIL